MAPKKARKADDDDEAPAPDSGKHVTLTSGELCDPEMLVAGDVLSRMNYITVVSNDGGSVQVRDTTGFEWSIGESILRNQAYASDQYAKVQKVTRIELARLLEQDVRDAVFSCCFRKLPNATEQDAMLDGADLGTSAKRKKLAKSLALGPERVLHGYITDTHELGRLPVFDLVANSPRLVDLRTLTWLTFKNVRYELK